ncbi:MAG TPA: hypothetical protein VF815_46810 [Myxococcaceae bacterium]
MISAASVAEASAVTSSASVCSCAASTPNSAAFRFRPSSVAWALSGRSEMLRVAALNIVSATPCWKLTRSPKPAASVSSLARSFTCSSVRFFVSSVT